jgi:hypothetical protein
MRVNVVSFTNYKLNVDIYSKRDMDFFSYLLLDVIVKKHEHILLDDIRVDMDIPDKIAYLYENAFYELLDNNLIEGNDKYVECYVDQLSLTKLGEECHKNKVLYVYDGSEYKEINISPFDDSICALDDAIRDSNLIVLNKVNSVDKVESIINENVKKIFPTHKGVRVVIKDIECDSYTFESELDVNKFYEFGLRDNLKFFDCEYKNVLDDGCEISTIFIDIKNVEYGKNNYSFMGVIDNVKYGFDYYVVDNIPYIKRVKLK